MSSPAGLPIRELFLGSFGRLPKETIVSLIRICMDESNSHDNRAGAPLMLSGCVSKLVKWERFDRRWRLLLRKHRIRRVHFAEIWHQHGEFADKSATQLVAAVKDFEETIFKYVRFGFSTVLYPDDFARFRASKGSNLHTILDSDYGVSIRTAYGFINALVSGLLNDPDPSIYILVEDGHENEGAVWSIFREYQKTTPIKDQVIKHAMLVRKDDCYGAQAADMRGSAYIMEERQGSKAYSDMPPKLAAAQEFIEGKKLPWFRLSINEGVLAELRDSVILSKRSYAQRYGHLLSSSQAQLASSPSAPAS